SLLKFMMPSHNIFLSFDHRSSGIGKGIVMSLVKAGCHVAIGARRVCELEKTQKEVSANFPGSAVKTLVVPTDVTKRKDVIKLVKAAETSLGPVDIMVNCAGVMYFTLMKNVMWDQWEAQVDVNCKGSMYGIGSVLSNMLKRGKGHIVNITSDAGT
ncbi:MAG: SDR family oxidoreductase, partial [Myxococcota bacterium]